MQVADLVLGVVGGEALAVTEEGYRVTSLLRAQGLPSFLLCYLVGCFSRGSTLCCLVCTLWMLSYISLQWY
jgi:hypothetical protein